MNNLVVVLIAISAHYIGEYMSENPGYECPKICEVDHIHLIKEKNGNKKVNNRKAKRPNDRRKNN